MRVIFKSDPAYSPRSWEAELQGGLVSTQHGRVLSVRAVQRRKELPVSGRLQPEAGSPPHGEVGEGFWKPSE